MAEKEIPTNDAFSYAFRGQPPFHANHFNINGFSGTHFIINCRSLMPEMMGLTGSKENARLSFNITTIEPHTRLYVPREALETLKAEIEKILEKSPAPENYRPEMKLDPTD